MPNTSGKTLQGVILDLDGTLVDSNDANARAWADALTEYGYPVPLDQIRKLVGMGADNLLPRAVGIDGNSEIGRQIDQLRGILLKEKYFATITPLPKARELLERTHADGLKLILASSAKKEEADALLLLLGPHVGESFDVRTTSSDAKRSKPAPDIVQAAISKSGLSAPECIMIGDTPYDVTAAQAAGVHVIAFRCGGWRDDDLEGAMAIYDDPADLLARYDDSPLAKLESYLARIAGQEIEELKEKKHR